MDRFLESLPHNMVNGAVETMTFITVRLEFIEQRLAWEPEDFVSSANSIAFLDLLFRVSY